MNNQEICLLIAIVLFVVAGVMSVQSRAWVATLTSFGLAVFALAFIVNP